MENIVFTQLSIPEIRQMFRQELETYFANQKQGNHNQPEQELPINITKAAEHINLAVPTLYSLVSRREIPFNKKGKRLYFLKSELTAWIRSGRRKTIAESQANPESHLRTSNRKSTKA